MKKLHSIIWIPPWYWEHSWCEWFWAEAHDSSSYFIRVFGFEIDWE